MSRPVRQRSGTTNNPTPDSPVASSQSARNVPIRLRSGFIVLNFCFAMDRVLQAAIAYACRAVGPATSAQ